MHDQIFTYVLLAGLAIALLWAAVTDFQSRTISNRLNLVVALGAPLFWWASGLSLWPDVGIQLGVAAATFAVCTLFFIIRQMGGGDVKLLTALALWFPPSNFLFLIVVMALLGWLLTLVMGMWSVAHSKAEGRKPVRDALLLLACLLIAVNFASAALGGPKINLPIGSLGNSMAAVLLAAFVPVIILAIVTFASIRIIKKHDQKPKVPYGLAISFAGLWVVGAGLVSSVATTAAG